MLACVHSCRESEKLICICLSSSMRWATFGDAFWYADNLAAMAKNGYSGLCRQDYIGADCAC